MLLVQLLVGWVEIEEQQFSSQKKPIQTNGFGQESIVENHR